MVPAFLKKFEQQLEKYKREAISIKAYPLEADPLEDPLDLKKSKFLGLPFFPKSKIYPLGKDGHPMLLAVQLNFSEIPTLKHFPTNGILQLFLSGTDWYDLDSQIIYHKTEELDLEPINDFAFLHLDEYDEMPIFKIHQLSFKKIIDPGGLEDEQFDFRFGDLDWLEFLAQLSKTDQKIFDNFFDTYGHKIGGYAQFTQSDPRGYGHGDKQDIHLLQIDSKDEIMFGDVGIGHVFINPWDLEKRDFRKAYFTWDCC